MKTILFIWATMHIVAAIQYYVKFSRYIKYGGGIPCVHLNGLPVGEADCVVMTTNDKVIVEVQKNRYELPYYKITAADVREKNQLVGASAGNIVAGAVLFGALGAIISARPQNKKEYIMIISCNSEYTNAIAFAVEPKFKRDAEKIVAKLRKAAPQGQQNITL